MPPVSLDMRQLSYYMNQNCDRVPGDLPYFCGDRKYMVTAAPGAGTGNIYAFAICQIAPKKMGEQEVFCFLRINCSCCLCFFVIYDNSMIDSGQIIFQSNKFTPANGARPICLWARCFRLAI